MSGRVVLILILTLIVIVLILQVQRPKLGQGVSGAGSQKGMQDSRTCLVSEPFRVYDSLPRRLVTQVFHP